MAVGGGCEFTATDTPPSTSASVEGRPPSNTDVHHAPNAPDSRKSASSRAAALIHGLVVRPRGVSAVGIDDLVAVCIIFFVPHLVDAPKVQRAEANAATL